MDEFASSPLRRSRRARPQLFRLQSAFGGDAFWHHRHVVARRRAPTSRTACVRRLVKSVGPFGPWCLRSNRVRCFSRPLYAAVFRGARHSVSSTLAGAAAELPCPFDEVVSPTSPEPRLGPLNFFKELELGRGPLVELPAIEFSIREHEPRFVETRLSTAGLPFGGRAAGVEVRSRFACAVRQGRHFSRSRGQDDNPMVSRLVHRQTPSVACS